MKIFISCYDKIINPDCNGKYIPIQTGSAISGIRLNCIHDNDTNDNISNKNDKYFDLCAFYYSAFNLVHDKNEIVGIVQNKRFLLRDYSFIGVNQTYPLTVEHNDINKCSTYLDFQDSDLGLYDMICPREDKMYTASTSLWDNWCLFHDESFLKNTLKIIMTKYPDYLSAFENIFLSPPMYYCYHNIFISRGEIYVNYAKWLFTIFNELEKIQKFDSSIDKHTKNIDGKYKVLSWLAEHLINVFILKNRLMVKHNMIINVK